MLCLLTHPVSNRAEHAASSYSSVEEEAARLAHLLKELTGLKLQAGMMQTCIWEEMGEKRKEWWLYQSRRAEWLLMAPHSSNPLSAPTMKVTFSPP